MSDRLATTPQLDSALSAFANSFAVEKHAYKLASEGSMNAPLLLLTGDIATQMVRSKDATQSAVRTPTTGSATSTSFLSISHAFLSSSPPHTRRVMCPA